MTTGFSGIFPAVVTPFTIQRQFAEDAFERLLDRLYSAECDGVYVCGQTGEGLLQSPEMRKQVAEASVRISPPGKSVIGHVGSSSTIDSVALATHAESIGAAAISSLPPLGGYSFDEVRTHYEALAAATKLPVYVYYFPEIAPSIATLDHILDLCSIPSVAGLKFTDFDLFKLSRIKAAGKTVFNGRDEVLVAGLLMGADGGIGSIYNLVPNLFVELYRMARQSRWDDACRVQIRINELISILLRFPLIPVIKTLLKWSGVDCGECLSPRGVLSTEQQRELRELLEHSSFSGATGELLHSRVGASGLGKFDTRQQSRG
jgi:N-acetylneuraminate lyase